MVSIGLIAAGALVLMPGGLELSDLREHLGPRAEVTLATSPSIPRPGSIVRVRVVIRNARGVGSFPFTLTYDPGIMEFIPGSAREGRFFRQGGAATSFMARAGRSRQGATGVVVGLSRLGTSGARGSGVVCELSFRALAPGTARLGLEGARLLSTSATPLPARLGAASLRVRGARR
ncbi:MAG TPA: cohesin domain-containing protein [Candidatus Polarisedimenticolia bacterium]|nr:cohesin domain-containing protein [Candidatus Polarisedimenticolia bacterium]